MLVLSIKWIADIRAPSRYSNGWRTPDKMYRIKVVGVTFLYLLLEVTSYFIPCLESPALYYGWEVGATQNHSWSTLRDLVQRLTILSFPNHFKSIIFSFYYQILSFTKIIHNKNSIFLIFFSSFKYHFVSLSLYLRIYFYKVYKPLKHDKSG